MLATRGIGIAPSSVGLAVGYLVARILAASGASRFALFGQRVLPFFPLMYLPEANLNGWLPTASVAFEPRWVHSFSDEQYIHGN